MLTKLKRIIKAGWVSFRRNGMLTVATLFVMVLTIFLATTFFLLQGMTNSLISSLQNEVDISVAFKENTLPEDHIKLRDELLKIPEVKDAVYVTKETVLAEFIAKYKDNPQMMESLREAGEGKPDGNPFVAYLNIKASTPGQYESISNFLSETSYQDIIGKVNYRQLEQIIKKIFSISSLIKKIGIGAAIILGILAALVTFNTIRLAIFNSREEISIMRLVGASNWFIRGPFIVQGIISGFISILIAILIFLPLCYFLSPKLGNLIPDFNLFHFLLSNFGTLLLLQILVGVGIGVLSSLIAIRKHLQV
jgi:cell division transport system permease protein